MAPAGSFLRVAVTVPTANPITFGTIALSGGFQFEAGADEVSVTVTNGSFTFQGISVTGVNGLFTWDGTDFAGSVSGVVNVTLGAAQVAGSLAVDFDDTGVTAKPSALTITISGYSLGGTVVVAPSGTDTTFTLTNGHIAVGPLNIDVPTATLTKAGSDYTGSITADVSATIGGVSVSGTVTITIDSASATTPVAFFIDDPTIAVGDITIHTGASPPSTAGLSLSASSATNFSVTIHDLVVSIGAFSATIPSASFTISPDGAAGSLTIGTLTSSLGSLGTIMITSARLELNTFDHAVTSPALPAGPFVRLSVVGLHVSGVSNGTGTFSLTTDALIEVSTEDTVLAVSDLAINNGTDDVITDGHGGFVVAGTGIAGVASGNTPFGPVSVAFNTGNQSVARSIEIGGETFVIDVAASTIQILGAAVDFDFGGVVKIQGTVSLSTEVAGAPHVCCRQRHAVPLAAAPISCCATLESA